MLHDTLETQAVRCELTRFQISCAARRPFYNIGKAIAELNHPAIFIRSELRRSQSRFVEEAPEGIARVGVVVAGRGRDESGIDPDEQELEPRRQIVGEVATRIRAPATRGRSSNAAHAHVAQISAVAAQFRGGEGSSAHNLVHLPLEKLEGAKARRRVGIACGDGFRLCA